MSPDGFVPVLARVEIIINPSESASGYAVRRGIAVGGSEGSGRTCRRCPQSLEARPGRPHRDSDRMTPP
jgi:hypothetical protein